VSGCGLRGRPLSPGEPGFVVFGAPPFAGIWEWASRPFFVCSGQVIRETLLRLLEPVIEALGYELVELEFHPQGRGGLLRIYLDREGGIGVDDCERASRQVSSVLDVEDPIPGTYTLEVSSPGLDRPLRKAEDYARFAGQRAKLELLLPRDGRRRFSGTLRGIEGSEVQIEVDGVIYRLPLADIGKARLIPEF